jgi:RsiW-degrading membrane proteinase PrsW (M82 family)
MSHVFQSLFIAFLGGFIPIFLWLWFFEHEDKHPEPKHLTVYAFLGGMLAVFLVIPFEKLVYSTVPNDFWVIVLWAAIEEIMKYTVAFWMVLRRADNDEPIDSMMYLIVTALGFAALENALFIFKPLATGHGLEALITGNFRFIGATLLHVVSSSIIGLGLSISFYAKGTIKTALALSALILAIILHAFFNLTIIISNGSKAMSAFYTVWILLVVILLLFERVKQIKKPQ